MAIRRRLYQNISSHPGWRKTSCITTDYLNYEYINTFVIATENIRIELDAEVVSSIDANIFVFFSTNDDDNNNRFGIISKGNSFNAEYGTQKKVLQLKAQLSTRYKITKDGNLNYINGVEYESNTANSLDSLHPILIGAMQPDRIGNMFNTSLKIYGCKIYKNDVLIRDYIPVAKNEEEALYDRINNELYFKNGSCEYYHTVSYITTSLPKKEYFDLGIKANSKTHINCDITLKDYLFAGGWFPLGASDGTNSVSLSSHSNELRFNYGRKYYILPTYITAPNIPVYISIYDGGLLIIENNDMDKRYEIKGDTSVFTVNNTIWLGGVSGSKQLTGIKIRRIEVFHEDGTGELYHTLSNGAEEVLINNSGNILHKSILTS